MFEVANARAQVTLQGATLSFPGGILARVSGDGDGGTPAQNGGQLVLNAISQVLAGDLLVDESSEMCIRDRVERSKIKARIAKLEDEKKDLYRTLGERFYALSKEPNPDGGELEALCAKLDALQKEIDEKREEDERIKNQ